MKITFDLEVSDQECAFFAIYAGLRMYKEQRKAGTPLNMVSIAGAEAFCMLGQLKEQHPNDYREAEEEYKGVYGPKDIVTLFKN